MTPEQKKFIADLLAEFVRHDAWTWARICETVAQAIDETIAPVITCGEAQVVTVTLLDGRRQEIGNNAHSYWMRGA